MKTFLIIPWTLALLISLPSRANQEKIEYAPSLETSVESIIEIGIERSGQQEVVINTRRKTTIGDKRETTNTLKDIKINSVEESRTKSTNPNKQKTRPKPSGLFGGVVRAFGGDYSVLTEWGTGFVDHMMEPKYNWDVNKVYYTKESRETTVTSSFTTSWDNQQEFETNIKQTYSADINKGFMKFSVAVRNIGERSVRIKSPEFVIHFVNPDEQLVYIDQVRPEQNSSVPISIAPGQSRTFGLMLKDRDFITLSQQYRDAIGVRVTMQDLFVEREGNQLFSAAEIQEDLEDTHVRVDYFDGANRSIRFFPVPATGKALDAFLEQVLINKSYQFNSQVQPDGVVDNFIERIGSLKSDSRIFSELTSLRERYDWRRWFITVNDDESTYFDARRSDKIFPGYSVRLGYYSADQILPANQYRPIIYERSNVILQPNRPIDIPIDLKPGDIVVFEDIKLQGFTINQIRFRASRKTQAQFNASVNNQSGGFFMYSLPTPSPAQSLMKHNTPPTLGPANASHLYLLEPQQVNTKNIDPGLLVRYKGMGNQDLPMPVKTMLGWMIAMEGFKQTFTHVEGAFKLDFPTNAFNTVHFSGVNPEHLLATMGMVLKPGETIEEYFNRKILAKGQYLTFVVEENVRADDSRWLFASPSLTVWPAYIRNSSNQLSSTVYGSVLGNYSQYLPMSISNENTPIPMFGGLPGGYMMPLTPDRNQALYSLIALSQDSAITDLPDSYSVERIHYSNSISLQLDSGPRMSTTLKVIRYR